MGKTHVGICYIHTELLKHIQKTDNNKNLLGRKYRLEISVEGKSHCIAFEF